MFSENDVVRVLLPLPHTDGFDYSIKFPGPLIPGAFVNVPFMNKTMTGVVMGRGSASLAPEKIKPISEILNIAPLTPADIDWIQRMSDWTMMTQGAVLRLIMNVEFREEKRKSKPLAIPTYKDTQKIVLTPDQKTAAEQIQATDKFKVHLLDGVTGSGKTQVYFDMAMRFYEAGKNVLIMMPEIALTQQFIKKFENKFGAEPLVWHSNLTPSTRRKIWRLINQSHFTDTRSKFPFAGEGVDCEAGRGSGNKKQLPPCGGVEKSQNDFSVGGIANTTQPLILIGTRSALFLPWKNLGLIIIDEEHDSSYKQDEMGSYHARDMALLRAKLLNIPVCLASATPSVETLRNVSSGKYSVSILPSRFGGAQLPTIEIIDLKNNKSSPDLIGGSRPNLSLPLIQEIQKTLTAKQQTMLFLNRRGFSPAILCEECGHTLTCPDCSVGMTYHRRIGKMLCHYCGRRQPIPNICPECKKGEMKMQGAGVEKIEAELRAVFPTARIEILSSDTSGDLAGIIERIEKHETDIIIGTQILAKGHHFPNITLVGVVDADAGLFGNDFRAAEKTFQQLFQVSGRAGRGLAPGRVMLQTYNPTHPVLLALRDNKREDIINAELKNREAAKMPPFGQLIAVIVESDREDKLEKFCAELRATAPNIIGAKIAGPVPAEMYQIRNWYRMRFLVHGGERDLLQPIIRKWIGSVKCPSNTRIKLDPNPQTFL
ncbi:MAG: primosomal protein N' [Rickettsiales bacterium]|jgi:primosomal protein N' (replication factor Y)|nr:primosomal protein N' [Rickettsiales bacterium]